jgi:hypothetical protein
MSATLLSALMGPNCRKSGPYRALKAAETDKVEALLARMSFQA